MQSATVLSEPRRKKAARPTVAELQSRVATLKAELRQRKSAEKELAHLETEMRIMCLLQEVSSALVQEGSMEGFYDKILEAAVAIMRSDMASMQIVDEKENALRMLAWRGFGPDFGETFKLNRADTRTSCSLARSRRERFIMADVEKCDYVVGTPALEGHRQSGIRAVQSTPLLSRAGKVLGMISTHWRRPYQPPESDLHRLDILAGQAADLLERRQTQQSIARLAAIVENSDDAIITKNLDGIITSWNNGAERIFGYAAEETVGKHVSMLIPEDRRDEEPSILRRLRAGQRIEHYETVRQRKDGTLLDISLTVSPLRDAGGNVVGASKIARDITELRRAREILKESNQELERRVAERTASLQKAVAQMEEFSYSVSHDLRAPVRAMKGFAAAIRDDHADKLPAEVRDYLERIVNSGERMERLINDVLTYSRLARSESPLQPVAIDKLIPDIVQSYPAMQPPQAEISIRHPLLPVLGHEPSLTQAISNLLANSVKFVAPNVTPKVKIWTEAENGAIRLWVEDNGIGIKPQYQNRLFRMFERLHQNGKYEGTGIGLAIVRKSVEKMGGRVGMKSDGEHGSAFWIELPSAKSP